MLIKSKHCPGDTHKLYQSLCATVASSWLIYIENKQKYGLAKCVSVV
jgi:hypothetical protein